MKHTDSLSVILYFKKIWNSYSNWTLVEVVEVSNHPFFMASQFHPEFASRPLSARPLFKGFIQACLQLQKQKK